MREVIPYKTVPGALKALDNGGRFYNIFTKADDGTITDSEMFKAAGVVSGSDKAFLFFSLALAHLDSDQQQVIISRLSTDLRVRFLQSRPQRVEIEDFDQVAKPAQSVIVDGYPRFLEDKTRFAAFIMIPIMAGKVTTFTMIPILDRFDVYEVYSKPGLKGRKTIIATVRGSRRLEPIRTVFGGIVKKLNFEPKAESRHRHYVETLYYVRNAEQGAATGAGKSLR